MPVAAVAVAVFQVVEAVEIGFAALSAFEAISVVSSVVGAVGAVTGNQDLAKIGAIGSAIGGVGSYAASNGWLGETAKGLGTKSLMTGESVLAKEGGTQTLYQQQIESALGITRGAAEIDTGATKELSNAGPTATPPAGTDTATASSAPGTASSATAPAATASTGTVAPAVTAPAVTGAPATWVTNETGLNVLSTDATAGSNTGLWDSFKNFAKANPTISYAGLTTAGSAVAGLFDPNKEAQKKELEARAAAERQAAATGSANEAYLRTQTANMNAPAPVAVAGAPRAPVYGIDPNTGKAVPYTSYVRQAGLLNSVTGKVA